MYNYEYIIQVIWRNYIKACIKYRGNCRSLPFDSINLDWNTIHTPHLDRAASPPRPCLSCQLEHYTHTPPDRAASPPRPCLSCQLKHTIHTPHQTVQPPHPGHASHANWNTIHNKRNRATNCPGGI